MIAARVNSPGRHSVAGIACLGLAVISPAAAWAQSAQQNTNALRPPDVAAGAELFGGLEARQDESGATLAPESPGDSDLGEQVILQESNQYQPLTISLQQRGVFTSNAGLTEHAELDDLYSYSELDIRYIPRITNRVFGNFSANYGLYRYSDHSALDFDSLETSAGLMGLFPGFNNLVAWTNYNYTRLSDGQFGHGELLNDHSLELGLYYPIPIGERHFAFGSYLSAFSLAGEPEYTRRDQHGVTLGYVFLPVEKVELSAYYQLFAYDYRKGGRRDLFHDLGLGVEWEITRNINVGLQGSYTINDSNIRGGDYTVGELGASLNVVVRF